MPALTRPTSTPAATVRPKRAHPRGDVATGRGVLMVVVGAEGRGKELLVAIARRRFEADASLEFPARLTTRSQSEANGDVVVSRRALRDMAAAGELMCRWETAGQQFGLGVAAHRSLDAGRTVVVVAGGEAVDRLRAVWDDVRVVEVMSGADSVRSALGRRPGTAGRRTDEGDAAMVVLYHPGDVATAVRGFHDIIARLRMERMGAAGPKGRGLASKSGVSKAGVCRVSGGAQARKGLRGERARA